MKKLLLVEDDGAFREVLFDILKKKYEVVEAPNGKVAKESLLSQSFDIVLTDIQMPQLTGIELLEWARERYSIPFVMMTGFSAVLETKSAYELGANGFIAKPFKNVELLSAIEAAFTVEKKPTVDEVTKKYNEISIEELLKKPKVDFDVYIKLSDTKFIRIAYKNQTLEYEQLIHYKVQGVIHLYISKNDIEKLNIKKAV